MFLHGDLLHLFGNMVFLLVFGRRVENQLERINFLTFYLTAGISAALAHMLDGTEFLFTSYRREWSYQRCLGSVLHL